MNETAPTPRVDFPEVDGARSTSAVGRTVVSDALAPIDPVGSRWARAETNWRSGYVPHFRRLIEAGVGDADGAVKSVGAGLASVQRNIAWVQPDGTEKPLSAALDEGSTVETPRTLTVSGTGDPISELVVPYRGSELHGAELSAQLDRWLLAGVLEPSAVDAIRLVAAHPEWLALPDRIVVALGAGSEIGPTPTLLGWGATIAGLDLPHEQLWSRVLDQAGNSAGRLLAPLTGTGSTDGPTPGQPGLDLLTDLPRVTAWLGSLPESDLVFGNYVYADGGTNLRLSAASDALGTRLAAERPSTVLAWMATPTDVFAVPREAVAQSVHNYEERGRLARGPGRLLRGMTGGRLLARAYLKDADPGLCDSLVPQQGPNYALGKRIHRWRATAEQAAGRRVSMNVAPPTRTVSVVRNKALAAAYAGAHRFGVEVFEPETTRVLMAALLVHDLMADQPVCDEPWQAEATNAVHGGLWRTGYAPRSALGLAAVLGYGSLR